MANQSTIYLNWSSGKDASMALHKLLQDDQSVGRLFTTVNGSNDRINMHGLHVSLLEEQAGALEIPLDILRLPESLTMETYNELMLNEVRRLKSEGLTTAVFGDIFLEDLREYRKNQLAQEDVNVLFPLWKENTNDLMQRFLKDGFKAIVVSVDAQKLDESFCGRIIDQSFLDDLPEDVDPCGENGEFHTFCFDGPIFKKPVAFEKQKRIYKTYPAPKGNKEGLDEYGFWYQDLTI